MSQIMLKVRKVTKYFYQYMKVLECVRRMTCALYITTLSRCYTPTNIL